MWFPFSTFLGWHGYGLAAQVYTSIVFGAFFDAAPGMLVKSEQAQQNQTTPKPPKGHIDGGCTTLASPSGQSGPSEPKPFRIPRGTIDGGLRSQEA